MAMAMAIGHIGGPPLCLYRAAVADLVSSRRYRQSWRAADAA